MGDTANDMALYGGKLYIVVNVSSTIEVIDFQTGVSIKQIPMLAENGSSRQPRHITFHKDKAYVCSYDGTVARIDTTSLEIDALTKAGRNRKISVYKMTNYMYPIPVVWIILQA